MITFKQTNELLKTLPIGYYLKNKLDVVLDENEESSYINIYSNEVVISYKQFLKAATNTSIEEDLRCLLYHEVSHALLTPTSLKIDTIINIFEDERIETICKDFYKNVNFKSFVKKLNNFDKSKPINSAIDYFYSIVRFRYGNRELVEKVRSLIEQYRYLNRTSTPSNAWQYYCDVYDFYNEVTNQWKQHQSSNKLDNSDDLNNSDESNSLSQSYEESEELEDTTFTALEEVEDTTLEEAEKIIQTNINKLNKEIANLTDTNLQNTFKQLILAKTKKDKRLGSAINSYSGMLDPRSCGRQDYKYFVQKNRLGNVKKFSKLKLNLFIDTSGSFVYSQNVVNKLLYNLTMLEKLSSDFSFDVVTMSYSETLLSKNKRSINCHGGNRLSSKIFSLFKQVQSNSANNINIVLFDGDALSFSSSYNDRENFKAFNNSSTIIISDASNECYIDEYCKLSKNIIVNGNYADLLIQNVVKSITYGLK